MAVNGSSTPELLDSLCRQRDQRLSRSSIGNALQFSSLWPPLLTTIVDNVDGEALLQFGQLSTPAVVNFKSGNRYEGDIDQCQLHGKGRYTWTDGTVYEGDFISNTITGNGVYHWPDGSWYEGQVDNGLRHGHGTFHCANDETSYTGHWLRGKRHGKGKIVYNENSYYDGDWENDTQCGMGIRQYSSGNMYEGMWKDNRRHGQGTMYWKDSGEQYSGEWVNGIQHGKGEHIWTMSNTDNSQYPLSNHYIGDWRNSIREGWGIFYYASGGHYEGEWSDNKKNGHGKYTLPNGHTIEGTFRNDKLVSRVGGLETQHQLSESSRPHTPLGSAIGDIDGEKRGATTEEFNVHISVLLSDTVIDPAHELKEVHSVILRYLTQLRRIYHFYSSLGGPQAASSTKMLKRIQLWQFLRDCQIYRHRLTLNLTDSIIQPGLTTTAGRADDDPSISNESEQIEYHPEDKFLMREFLQCLVFVAHHIYSDQNGSASSGQLASCLDQFLKQDCLPRACKIQGHYFSSSEVSVAMQPHLHTIWDVYQSMHENGCPPTLRKFQFFVKNCTKPHLTAEDIVSGLVSLQPLAMDTEGSEYNMEIPMVFLEFLEGLLYFALQWHQKCVEKQEEQERKQKETAVDNERREEEAAGKEKEAEDTIEEDVKDNTAPAAISSSNHNMEEQTADDTTTGGEQLIEITAATSGTESIAGGDELRESSMSPDTKQDTKGLTDILADFLEGIL